MCTKQLSAIKLGKEFAKSTELEKAKARIAELEASRPVPCTECKWYRPQTDSSYDTCSLLNIATRKDGFCHHGEREKTQ